MSQTQRQSRANFLQLLAESISLTVGQLHHDIAALEVRAPCNCVLACPEVPPSNFKLLEIISLYNKYLNKS